jgi:hypothetical protein
MNVIIVLKTVIDEKKHRFAKAQTGFANHQIEKTYCPQQRIIRCAVLELLCFKLSLVAMPD